MRKLSRSSIVPICLRAAHALLLAWVLSSCAGNYRGLDTQSITAASALSQDQAALEGATGARVIFRATDFYTPLSPRPDTGCAGDIKTYYHPSKATNAGAPVAFPLSVLDPYSTVKPAFIKNISLDISDANSSASTNQAYGCSYGNLNSSLPPPSVCSTFDLAGFVTGYYTFLDKFCDRAGPISIGDPSINKLLAGGVYIDIDRDQLGDNENLLLTLTHLPLDYSGRYSDASYIGLSGAATFKVHLIKSGLSASEVRLAFQPRHLLFADTDRFPQIVQSLAVFAPPRGQIRQEQIIVPLGIDAAIDRIRIERFSGTGILMEASVLRMGGS